MIINDEIKIGVAAAIIILFIFLIYDRQALKAEIEQNEATIARLSDANKGFSDAAMRNNAAIEQEKALRDAAEAKYKTAMIAADASAKAHKKSQSAIINDVVTGDHCEYAHKLFTEHMKERHL